MQFIDSISCLQFPLRRISSAFGLTASKSWYPHYFNTEANLKYVARIPNVSYHDVDEMSDAERTVSGVVRQSKVRNLR